MPVSKKRTTRKGGGHAGARPPEYHRLLDEARSKLYDGDGIAHVCRDCWHEVSEKLILNMYALFSTPEISDGDKLNIIRDQFEEVFTTLTLPENVVSIR